MYIELVRRVIEQAVALHAANTQQTKEEVLETIREHIEATSDEYWNVEPKVKYDDPLCRLGYLYMNVPINATLFETVLRESDNLRQKMKDAAQGVLNICSLGGGPDTELLGIAKRLLRYPNVAPPGKIFFTVIDTVPQWAETWQQLAAAVEQQLSSSLSPHGVQPPTINQTFLPFNVLASSSYQDFAFQFTNTDILVFNYLFSENKTKLSEAQQALERLAQITPKDCSVVVIDRLENNQQFTSDVASLFASAFGVQVNVNTLSGTLDGDEQTSEMGQMLLDTFKRRPRIKFFTNLHRNPTVFWFVVNRI